jgi:hypothetical protein
MSPFRVAAAQCKKICPERLSWPCRLAGISEKVVEFQNIFSRPLFTIIFKPKIVFSRVKILVHLF